MILKMLSFISLRDREHGVISANYSARSLR